MIKILRYYQQIKLEKLTTCFYISQYHIYPYAQSSFDVRKNFCWSKSLKNGKTRYQEVNKNKQLIRQIYLSLPKMPLYVI